LGIDVGDFVFVQRSGEVIPKVIGLARPSPTKSDPNKVYQLPRTCPCCSTALVRPEDKVHFYCPNIDCYDQVYARLVFSVGNDALDIDGCGEVGVKLLMKNANVRRLSDLFHLKDFSFFKPAQRKKVQDGLEKSKKAPLWRKLAALNIEGIGKVSSQDLATKFSTLSGMFEGLTEEELEDLKKHPKLPGTPLPDHLPEVIGKVASAAFREWVGNNLDELEYLQKSGFEFFEDKKASGPLTGKAFCITGTLASGRNEVSAMIEQYGGVVKGSVTRKVDYLVQGSDGGQGKASGASKWGTVKISEEELYRMIGIPMPVNRRPAEDFEP
jgi:DNA ligase (NAD+)